MATFAMTYCSLQGEPAITNGLEAWAYSGGEWFNIGLYAVAMEATVISKAAFDQTFGTLPELPAKAFSA